MTSINNRIRRNLLLTHNQHPAIGGANITNAERAYREELIQSVIDDSATEYKTKTGTRSKKLSYPAAKKMVYDSQKVNNTFDRSRIPVKPVRKPRVKKEKPTLKRERVTTARTQNQTRAQSRARDAMDIKHSYRISLKEAWQVLRGEVSLEDIVEPIFLEAGHRKLQDRQRERIGSIETMGDIMGVPSESEFLDETEIFESSGFIQPKRTGRAQLSEPVGKQTVSVEFLDSPILYDIFDEPPKRKRGRPSKFRTPVNIVRDVKESLMELVGLGRMDLEDANHILSLLF